MNGSISRESLKANFLKKLIIRADFKGIVSLDETIDRIKEFLFNKGFLNLDEKFVNEADLELKDPELIETKFYLPLKELKQTKSYRFTSETYIESSGSPELTLEISKYFAIFDINPQTYRPFDSYVDIFCNLLILLKEKNEFFKTIRLGIRKIDSLIFKEIDDIPLYFDERCYNPQFFSLKEKLPNLTFTRAEGVNSFVYENTNFNFITYIDKGLLDDKEAFQTILDIDGYIKNEDSLLKNLTSLDHLKQEMIRINDLLFDLFISSLTESFLLDLQRGKTIYEDMIGVEPNER